MDQIITLLTNLFNLTKVAAVTLPGLLAAGGLALILWPARPIDLIPHVDAIHKESITEKTVPAGTVPPCPETSRVLIASQACSISFSEPNRIFSDLASTPPADPETRDTWARLADARRAIDQPSVPWVKGQQMKEQLILDLEGQNLAKCVEIETALKGREETENLQFKSDLDNLEKQRTAAQDNYLAYQKSNSPLASHYRSDMRQAQACIATNREDFLLNEANMRERERRLSELARDQQIVKDRLTDPGRLRPRQGIDTFLTGLVNHVVGFILLSLAAAVLVTAISTAVFAGGLFEDAFDGF